MKIEDLVEWWKNATSKERENFLHELGDDAYSVAHNTWYVHPIRDEEREQLYKERGLIP